MSGRRKISDGVFLSILPDGTIAGGVRSRNPMPKVYTTEKAARDRVKNGGYVLRVTATDVSLVVERLQHG